MALVFSISPQDTSASTWRGDTLLAQLAKAPWKFALIRIQPQIVLTDFGYDTNLYSQPNAVGDYTLTAGMQINAFLSLKKKIVFTLSESPRYVYYFETARERTWNNYLRSDVNFLLNKFFISAGVYRNDARQRWNYEIDIRPRLKETGYHGSFLWQPTRRMSLEVGYRQAYFRYENLAVETFRIADLLNRDESYITLSAFLQLTARTRTFLELEHGFFDFTDPLNPRDSRSYAGYTGFDFSTLGKIRGRIRLGYKYLVPLTQGMPEYKGFVGDTSVSVSIMRPLVIRGSYRRDVRPSLWYDNPYYTENYWGAGASLYIFRRRVRLDYDYSQGLHTYPLKTPADTTGDAQAGNPAPIAREDRFLTQTIGLFFRLTGDIGFGIRAGRYNRKMNVYNWNINRDFIGLNLIYDF